MERIQKILSAAGLCSRRQAEQYIAQGRVTVNGAVASLGAQADPEADRIMLDGTPVSCAARKVYLMLNKPQGYVSATFDKHYKVVTDLIDDEYNHFEPFVVGRLDIDTLGLLILTNDGDFCHNMLSPKHKVPKTYLVESEKEITPSDIKILENEMDLGDFTTMGAKVKIISDDFKKCELTIYEGKFHQVKRMFEKIENKVIYLKRLSMGPFMLDDNLKEGSFRPFTKEELGFVLNYKNERIN